MKILKRDTNGITLIALVITIILLLILAGITISQLTGSGLFENAKRAKIISDYTTAKEIIKLELMSIHTECIKEGRDYNIIEIENGIERANHITIDNIYYSNTAKLKSGLELDISRKENLIGILVSVDQYSQYKFLIGKEGDIEKAVQDEIPDTIDSEKLKPIDEFERDVIGITPGTNDENKEDEDEKEETIDIPGVEENIDTSNPIEITTYIAIRNNSKNTLNLTGVENTKYEMQEKTADIELAGNIVIANKNSDSKDSCQIKITGTYNGQSYINNLIVYVEPKNITTVTDRDENVEKAYAIYVPQDLVRLSELINHKVAVENYNAKIMNDIDLKNVCQNKTISWQPIGNYNENEAIYTGIFDGNNKQIYNIFINEPTKRYQSLFGKIENSFIKNLTVEGNITGYQFTGGIIGWAINSDVLNCTNNVEIIAKFNATGGILGIGEKNMKIERCINNKPIQQEAAVAGGIIGATLESEDNIEFSISECINKGTVTVSGINDYNETYAGGIIGNNWVAIITNCYNIKEIHGKSMYVGGIAGHSATEITNCYNSGSINSDANYHGGIVGATTDADVSNCINCGSVSDENITLVNLVGVIEKKIGSIIGYTTYAAQVENCLSIEKSTLVEYTDEEIKNILSNAFKKDKNEGLPILNWE